MLTRVLLAPIMALLVVSGASRADAQDSTAPKGASVSGLVTSLGGFNATVNAPILVTGSTVTIEPGGQTGRQQFRVPTFVYVLDGILTTFYEAGPVGISGAQYHGMGQSFMDNSGWWHNYTNKTDKPVRVLLLHLGYPGRPDPIQKGEPQ